MDVVRALRVWDQERIQATLTKKGIEWKFNPPAASHQWGVWERLICLIRGILHSLIEERLLNDEALRTFLAEFEKILNDRPITSVWSDLQDFEALTPNHILLLLRNASVCPDVFEESDKFKERWKRVFIFSQTNFGADGRKSTCRHFRSYRNGYVRSLTSELVIWF